MDERFRKQLEFLAEIDALKGVVRRSYALQGERFENSAEHSWHMAMMGLILSEYVPEKIDLAKVVKMCLVHDIVEVDVGDTFCYDTAANVGREDREREAAERIFGMLPSDQSGELRALWDEFEERRTPEARYANALDRFQAFSQNYNSSLRSWKESGVRKSQVVERSRPIRDSSEVLWRHVEGIIEEAVERGYLGRD